MTTLIHRIVAEIARATGRRYKIQFDLLDAESQHEMLRLLNDLEYEKRIAARKAQLTPWRRP